MMTNADSRAVPLVLVADDDPTMRLLIRESIEQAEFTVIEAADGRQALDAFDCRRPDVVVMDVKMPEMDGFTACREIRQRPFGEHIPVLMVTGLDDLESINRAFEMGATDFVCKPINWAVLTHHVRYLYRASRAMVDLSASQANLKQKAEQLAHSNSELEQFAYVASHDLQEPLRMVSSYTQMLAKRYKDKLDGDAEEFIGYVLDGAARMRQLIQDLLTYSRVGTAQAPLEPTDVAQVLAITLGDLEFTIQANGVKVTHDPLPTVVANDGQMKQLLQNLLVNAIKFHGERAPAIHIGAERKGADWLFSVRDNGIGIAPEYAERIFVMFQRLHSGGEYPGTGIGLSICKKIVDRFGGRIWVESEPGNGSAFYFTIPA